MHGHASLKWLLWSVLLTPMVSFTLTRTRTHSHSLALHKDSNTHTHTNARILTHNLNAHRLKHTRTDTLSLMNTNAPSPPTSPLTSTWLTCVRGYGFEVCFSRGVVYVCGDPAQQGPISDHLFQKWTFSVSMFLSQKVTKKFVAGQNAENQSHQKIFDDLSSI